MDKFLAVIGGLVLFVLGVAAFAVFGGWVFSILWGWFVVPVFGLPQLSVVQAIGLSLMIGYMTHHLKSDDKDNGDDEDSAGAKTLKNLLFAIFYPLLILSLGWVIHLFM